MTTLPVKNGGSFGLGGIQDAGQLKDVQGLQQLAQIASILQNASNPPVETARIGNSNVLVDRQGPNFGNIAPTLNLLAQQKQQTSQLENRKKFMKSIENIMGSNANNDDKIKNLITLEAQHGTDYGIGIKNIAEQFNKQSDRALKKETLDSKKTNKVTTIEKTLGEIETGARNVTGGVLEFSDEKEVRDHVIRKHGPDFATKNPELEEALQRKFGPDQFGFRIGQPHPKNKKFVYIGENKWKKK